MKFLSMKSTIDMVTGGPGGGSVLGAVGGGGGGGGGGAGGSGVSATSIAFGAPARKANSRSSVKKPRRSTRTR